MVVTSCNYLLGLEVHGDEKVPMAEGCLWLPEDGVHDSWCSEVDDEEEIIVVVHSSWEKTWDPSLVDDRNKLKQVDSCVDSILHNSFHIDVCLHLFHYHSVCITSFILILVIIEILTIWIIIIWIIWLSFVVLMSNAATTIALVVVLISNGRGGSILSTLSRMSFSQMLLHILLIISIFMSKRKYASYIHFWK